MLDTLQAQGIRLGLDQPRRLGRRLGSPQTRFPTVLVAGTNGKGSTASLLDSIMRAAGYRTGLYTSPHLESVTERVVVDGRPIADHTLAKILEHLAEVAARTRSLRPPTPFEALTLAAFSHFATESLDLAIIEVGLGGRLDATNLTEPILSLITSIDLDHQDYLGTTRAAIAREKCGILRPGRPALTWGDGTEVDEVLLQEARRRGASLSLARDLHSLEPVGAPGGLPQTLLWRRPGDSRGTPLELHLLGSHQHNNLGLAVAAAEALRSLGWRHLESRAISQGVRNCRWPGRAEWVSLGSGAGHVLLDGAHNPAGARALAAISSRLETPPDLLFGVLQDKDADEMLEQLAPTCRSLTLTRPPGPRGLDPARLGRWARSPNAAVEPDCHRALARALERMGTCLVICGSLTLVGTLRRELRRRFGAPAATTPELD